MKKKYILLLLLVGLLTGCTSASAAEEIETIENESISSKMEIESIIDIPVKKADNINRTEEETGIYNADKAYETQRAGISEEYIAILEQIYEAISTDTVDESKEYITLGIWEACLHRDEEENLSSIGYMIYDIDGNGVKELIIANRDRDYASITSQNRILSMYSISDNKPVLILEGVVRGRYYVLDDGTIYHSGSEGAEWNMFGIYSIADDGFSLEEIDYYYSAPVGDYRDYTVEWFHDITGQHDKAELLEDGEAWAIEEGFEARIKELDFSFFKDYK